MAAVTSVVYYHNIETSNFPKLLIGKDGEGLSSLSQHLLSTDARHQPRPGVRNREKVSACLRGACGLEEETDG